MQAKLPRVANAYGLALSAAVFFRGARNGPYHDTISFPFGHYY